MSVKSYRDLPVYQLSFRLAVEIDEMTHRLPKHEFYEEGGQIRRSAKSIPTNLAEGYGRRRYRNDYIRFIVYALASCDETRVHLDLLHEIGSLPKDKYHYFTEQYILLGKQLNGFLKAIIKKHQEPYREQPQFLAFSFLVPSLPERSLGNHENHRSHQTDP